MLIAVRSRAALLRHRVSCYAVAIQNAARTREAQDIVGAVLNQRGACVAEQLFDSVLLAEAIAAEYLERVARDLERCLCAERLGRDRVLQRRSPRGLVVDHHGP